MVSMVRMGSPVRFRRGAPPRNCRSGRVLYLVCRMPKSRHPPFARDLPVRFARYELVPAACRGHFEASLAVGPVRASGGLVSEPRDAFGRTLGALEPVRLGAGWVPRHRPARWSTTGAKVSMSPSATTR